MAAADGTPPLTFDQAANLARRALRNIEREYPNQPHHRWEGDTDGVPPRVLHPAFFGCFDWHSAVHTHWLLARLLNVLSALGEAPEPTRALAAAIETALARSFEPAKLLVEASYLARRPTFERPYGLAWLLALAAEAAAVAAPLGARWAAALQPLADAAEANFVRWLGNLRYPVRSGTHNQTAFALTLLADAAPRAPLATLVATRSLELYSSDVAAPLRYEPSGEDFLSPALMAADLLRRFLPQAQFAAWLEQYLPDLPRDGAPWLPVAEVSDETDGKLVHLHGLNLSRAWNLRNIAAALPPEDPRSAALLAAAARHCSAGVGATLAAADYAGDHWLPTFAVYLLTQPLKMR